MLGAENKKASEEEAGERSDSISAEDGDLATVRNRAGGTDHVGQFSSKLSLCWFKLPPAPHLCGRG